MGILNKKSTNTFMEETIIETFWGTSPNNLDKTIIEKESIHFYLKNQNPLQIRGTYFDSKLNKDFPYNQFHIHGSNEQGLVLSVIKTTPNIQIHNHTDHRFVYRMNIGVKLIGDLVFNNVWVGTYHSLSRFGNNSPHALGDFLSSVRSMEFGEIGGIMISDSINPDNPNVDKVVFENYMSAYKSFKQEISLPHINLVVVDTSNHYCLIIHMDLVNRDNCSFKRYGNRRSLESQC